MNSSIWLLYQPDLSPGASAILGENIVAFLIIHILAISLISVSMTGCVLVVAHILWSRRQDSFKLDMSVRFPMYLAIFDIVFEITHISDHLYLFITQKISESKLIRDVLSGLMATSFVWIYLFRSALSLYTYIQIVHGYRFTLGKWEWRFHLSAVLTTVILLPTFVAIDSFGCSGYWMSYNATSTNGLYAGIFAAFCGSINAALYIFCYCSIKRTVFFHKRRIEKYKQEASDGDGNNRTEYINTTSRHHWIALKCLTTHIWIGSCIYFPLAILLSLQIFTQFTYDAISPVIAALLVMVANSSGWANTWGYFYNERVKRIRSLN